MANEPKPPDGHRILTDSNARASWLARVARLWGHRAVPAFLSRPWWAPVYYGFPLIEETRTDGWCFGAISAFDDEPDGCQWGDGYVVAPDGSRAGLVWEVGTFAAREISPPDQKRWGVYNVAFPRPVRHLDDLVLCFRAVLPELREIHRQATAQGTSIK
ncbi:MAG: hypothetical protein AMXMBFR57_15200 [Acidimicrobiia bacterium]|jgi:hypothetical protein